MFDYGHNEAYIMGEFLKHQFEQVEVFLEKKDYDTALKILNAINETSCDEIVNFQKAIIFLEKRQLDKANAHIDLVLAKIPNEPILMRLKCLVAWAQDDYEGLISQCEKILELSPNDYYANLYKAKGMEPLLLINHDKNRDKKIIAQYNKTIEIEPKNCNGHCEKARFLYYNAYQTQALKEIVLAYKLDANSDATLLLYAEILEGMEKYDEANDIYDRLLQLYPDNEDAKFGNERLKKRIYEKNTVERYKAECLTLIYNVEKASNFNELIDSIKMIIKLRKNYGLKNSKTKDLIMRILSWQKGINLAKNNRIASADFSRQLKVGNFWGGGTVFDLITIGVVVEEKIGKKVWFSANDGKIKRIPEWVISWLTSFSNVSERDFKHSDDGNDIGEKNVDDDVPLEYSENQYIWKWWTKKHDDVLSSLISRLGTEYYWKITEEILKITSNEVIKKWQNEDPICKKYAWNNVIMYFGRSRAKRLGLSKGLIMTDWWKENELWNSL